MKKKINLRLAEIAVFAVFSTVIGITFIYYSLFQNQVREDIAVSAKLLRDTGYFENVEMKGENISLSSDYDDLRVTWISSDGTVLYDNGAKGLAMENHLDRPEIRDALVKGEGESVRRSDTMNENTFYYALLLKNGTVLRVATDAKSLFSVFVSVLPVTAGIILVVIVICIVISRMLTAQLIRPIEEMAENISDTEYESPYSELNPFSEIVRAQHAEILRAAKARQDFTANVSHELKTPLTAISGYAELLETDMVSDDKKEHFYKEIRRNSERLLSMINDIIRLSELDMKNPELEFSDVDLLKVAHECKEELMISAMEKDIEISLEGNPLTVKGNRDMIKELLENLVQNAVRYNNPGGKVRIEVGLKEERPCLAVRDNGIGIPEEDQERVFERFYRVDKSRSKAKGGSGLGLAIVKHIVEIHDAKIELVSAPDKGTEVKVIF